MLQGSDSLAYKSCVISCPLQEVDEDALFVGVIFHEMELLVVELLQLGHRLKDGHMKS